MERIEVPNKARIRIRFNMVINSLISLLRKASTANTKTRIPSANYE